MIISSSGDLVSTYNKAHLFDVEIPGKFRLKVNVFVVQNSDRSINDFV